MFTFPSSGPRNLKFQEKWLHKWPWLSYSKKVDGAYCKFCVLFHNHNNVGVGKHQKPGKLCSEKFCTWKNAIERFNEHQQCKYHQNNVENADLIMKIGGGEQDPIDLQINREAKKQILENRNKIKPIIETVLFCGRQGLALRGHRDSGRVTEVSEENDGNFRELLRYRAKTDETLRQLLASAKNNALYSSWRIQNEIIEISNDLILKKLVSKVNSSPFFSVLADETTDIAGMEQMSLCVRIIDPAFSKIEELFLQFVPLQEVTGKAISTAIIENLMKFGVDMSTLRGQGYDGAASMSGKFNGVQAHIQELYPTAVYVHCAAHSLNLAVSSSCEVPPIRNTISTIGRLYEFFNTPKRQSVLKQTLDEAKVSSSHEKLKRLCATRWTERYNSVAVVVELYDGIVMALETISEWPDRDSANAANQLNSAIRKADFVVSLEVLNQVFSHSSFLCKLLQQRNIDLKKASNLAEDTELEIRNLRGNAGKEFSSLFSKAQEKAEKFDFFINKPRTTAIQTKRCNVNVDSAEDYYRILIYIPFLDAFVTNLKERFSKHKTLLAGFQSLLPTDPFNLTEATFKEFENLVSFYKDDLTGILEELKVELKFWYRAIARLEEDQRPKNAIAALKYCAEAVSLPNIKILLSILAVLPVSTAENERTFSVLRRLKNYLRNSSSESRLNGLTLLHVYRDMTPTTEEMLNKLSEKPRKLEIKL